MCIFVRKKNLLVVVVVLKMLDCEFIIFIYIYLPRGEVTGRSAHLVDSPAHELGQLLVIDPNNLFLGNVVVLVFLQSPVLAVCEPVLAEGTLTAAPARALAVGVVGGVVVDAAAHLQVPGVGQYVRQPLVVHLRGAAVLRAARERRYTLLLA